MTKINSILKQGSWVLFNLIIFHRFRVDVLLFAVCIHSGENDEGFLFGKRGEKQLICKMCEFSFSVDGHRNFFINCTKKLWNEFKQLFI